MERDFSGLDSPLYIAAASRNRCRAETLKNRGKTDEYWPKP
jgi:hypothetical protein